MGTILANLLVDNGIRSIFPLLANFATMDHYAKDGGSGEV